MVPREIGTEDQLDDLRRELIIEYRKAIEQQLVALEEADLDRLSKLAQEREGIARRVGTLDGTVGSREMIQLLRESHSLAETLQARLEEKLSTLRTDIAALGGRAPSLRRYLEVDRSSEERVDLML